MDGNTNPDYSNRQGGGGIYIPPVDENTLFDAGLITDKFGYVKINAKGVEMTG